MSEKANFILRLYLVLVIITGAITAQLWVPSVFGIDLLKLSTKTLLFANIVMSVIIFLILGRPVHFIVKALKRK